MKLQNKIAIIIFSLLVIIAIGNAIYREYTLKNKGVIIHGKILKEVFSAKSPVMLFKFQYYYNGDTISGYSNAGVKYSTIFMGKSFPVRYSPNSGFSEILIVPMHFEKYGLKYPDSLEWVKKYLIVSE